MQEIDKQKAPVKLVPRDQKKGYVLMDENDYDSIMETIYLYDTGTLNKVEDRRRDDSGTTNVDDIDWDSL
ncbi:prevent-host-death protein [Pediococcus argentinicus]|nr:prevent-host-death protein [Pediococcus argentinicus]